MKTLFLIPVLFFVNFISAQVDLEDRDESFILLNNKNIQKIEIKEPFYQVPAKDCGNFTMASFEGGASAYKEILKKYMYTFLNSEFYTLNGEFTFTLTIDANGRVSQIEGAPKIQYSEVFFDDMQYVVRRIKNNWTPAKCDGKPVQSQMQLKMNFTSLTADL